MLNNTKDIIRLELQKRGMSFYRLAKEIGVDPVYLSNVLSLTKISRPVIMKISDYLQRYDLLYWYEKDLMARNTENKKQKSPAETGAKNP